MAVRTRKTICRLGCAVLLGCVVVSGAQAQQLEPAVMAQLPAVEIEPLSRPAVELVRTLQLLQDQIAEGSREAFAAQKGLITALEQRLLSMDKSVWSDPANVDAAVVFALSGGPPTVLRRLVNEVKLEGPLKNVVFGSLAFLEGRRDEARKHVEEVQLRGLGIGLRAQMYFVHASLLVGSDARLAIELLDRVRLEAPGTLLEEAALRRQLLVARELGDFPRFAHVAGEYMRRFPNSIYSGNFRQRLEAGLVKFEFGDSPDHFSQMAKMLSGMEPAAQREMYLAAARNLVEAGRVKSALPIAQMAKTLASDGSDDLNRARLYLGASQVVSSATIAGGLENLDAVVRSGLGPKDLKLLDSALAVGATIGKSADLRRGGNIPPAKSDEATNSDVAAESSMIKRASEALLGADKLLYK